MLKGIEISNFRTFRHLAMADLPRVCLISGKNSVGKSTLLEAIFFFYCSHMNDMLMRAQITRAKPMPPDSFLPSLFHAYDVDNKAVLKFTDESSINTNYYTVSKKESLSQPPNNAPFSKMIVQNAPNMVNNTFQVTTPNLGELSPTSALVITKERRAVNSPPASGSEKTSLLTNYGGFSIYGGFSTSSTLVGDVSPPAQRAFFLPALETRTTASPLTSEALFSKLQGQRRNQAAVDTIKKIVPAILNIRLGAENNQPILMCDVDGLPYDIPLSHMGGGVLRSFDMILQTLASEADIVLIDEIENGIHYSALSTVWAAILANAEKNSCQVFATTHSYECIVAAIEACKASNISGEDDLFAYYRLQKRGEDVIEAVRYRAEDLAEVIDSDWEIR